MPTNRRRHMRGRRSGEVGPLEGWIGWHLDWGPFGAPDHTEEFRDAYDVHRDAVLANWIARSPGTRPWSWWHYEAEEDRLVLVPNAPDDAEDDPPSVAVGPRGRRGRREGGHRRVEVAGEWVDYLETEADYLTRLDLWEPGEREAYEAME